jgi:hypothetical protein
MSSHDETVPQGYMKDAQGRLVPVDQVREIDRARDELVGQWRTSVPSSNSPPSATT